METVFLLVMLKFSLVGNNIVDKKSFGFFTTREFCESHIVHKTHHAMREGKEVIRKDRQNNSVLSKMERAETIFLPEQKRILELNMEVITEEWFCLEKNLLPNEKNPLKW